MKEFNLDEYLKNPSQKIVTRDGRSVRIVCTDVKGEHPIMALIHDKQEELAYRYLRNGRQLTYTDSPLDLCLPTTKKEGWINVFRDKGGAYIGGSSIFETEKRAKEVIGKKHTTYLTTIKIEWEE